MALIAFGQAESATKALLLDAIRVEEDIVAVGEQGAILLSNDNGKTWRRAACPVSSTLTGLSFSPYSKKGWAVGHQGALIETDNGGYSWKEVKHTEAPDSIFLDVLALDQTRVIVIGAYGMAMTTEDAGKTWQRIKPVDEDRHLNRISLGSDGTIFIAGEGGLLLRSRDRGKSWEAIPSPYEGSFFGILSLKDGSLMAYGLRGHVFISRDSLNIAWKPIPTGVKGLLACAIQLKDGRVLLAGQARNVLLSSEDISAIARIDSTVTSSIAELVQAADGTLLCFGEAGVTPLPLP